MTKRNRDNGHVHSPGGLDQLGEAKRYTASGYGHHQKNDSSAPSKPKSISARVAMSRGQKARFGRPVPVTLPKVNF